MKKLRGWIVSLWLTLATFCLLSAGIAKHNIVEGIGGWLGWVFYAIFVFAIVVSANAVYNELVRRKRNGK